ncbi:MinD/ParA family protein [Pseudalkalibacillus berkeleyi]|uniref:MinD/ParA family protein n=1 Tax=Pseudalkalibacillus berkeleyi TaxID=1069813 RepID=A0ABS9GZE3_9BACL|nr:MinD/ParA family protein [Pseudalkalibacillus berkeleyi]MCF6137126.1 MinD/ParA family protein [Pseudalkalibacillus berkeleyi]
MRDQAEMLRQRLNNESRTAKVCAVVSGKGGVGKSNFTVNLALSLIQSGSKVLLLDLDIGMANLDILMGVHSKYTIVDMVEEERPIIEMIETGPGGLEFIAGGNGLNHLFQLNDRQFNHFCEQINNIQDSYDYIFLDMAAGASKDGLQFITAADQILLITTPEPTAITDAYAMLKFVHKQDPNVNVSITVNRAENHAEGIDIADRVQYASRQFLQKELSLLGVLPEDPSVFKAVKVQQPYLLYDPNTKISKAMLQMTTTFKNGSEYNRTAKDDGFIQKLTRYFKRKQGVK